MSVHSPLPCAGGPVLNAALFHCFSPTKFLGGKKFCLGGKKSLRLERESMCVQVPAYVPRLMVSAARSEGLPVTLCFLLSISSPFLSFF